MTETGVMAFPCSDTLYRKMYLKRAGQKNRLNSCHVGNEKPLQKWLIVYGHVQQYYIIVSKL